jgi:uncharacterized membrane protein
MITKKFPVDRTIFFSDAVFAIAMTLLILEIKLPTTEELETLGIANILLKRIPNFIGFSVSFLVTALFWKAHLQICSFVKTVDNRFLWLNIWLLFFVVLMPFATALYSNYGFFSNVAFGFYCVNVALIGFLNYLLMIHVMNTENLAAQFDKRTMRWKKLRALLVPIVFLLCILLAQVAPIASRYGFILIFILHTVGERMYNKKNVATVATTVPEEERIEL